MSLLYINIDSFYLCMRVGMCGLLCYIVLMFKEGFIFSPLEVYFSEPQLFKNLYLLYWYELDSPLVNEYSHTWHEPQQQLGCNQTSTVNALQMDR